MSVRSAVVFSMLVASLGLLIVRTPSAAAASTCFGHAATVVPVGNTYALTPGDDVVVGTKGDDDVTTQNDAGGGTDFICTGNGDDYIQTLDAVSVTINAGNGNDSVSVRYSGTADVTLGQGNDFTNIFDTPGIVRGGTGDDVIFFQGFDVIRGTTVDGGTGNDLIQSAAGDFITGGSGKDTIIDQSGSGASSVDCGSGIDVYYTGNTLKVRRCETPY